MFSAENFIVLALTCSSVIHCELIFVCGKRNGFNLFCMWLSNCPRTMCWKLSFSLIEFSWLPFHQSVDNRYMTLFPDSQFCSLYQYVCLMSVTHCPDYCNFMVSFEIGKWESSNFALLFQERSFGPSWCFKFPHEVGQFLQKSQLGFGPRLRIWGGPQFVGSRQWLREGVWEILKKKGGGDFSC